jgi:threonyl-tRNA synthetase
MKITLPDGKKLDLPEGATALQAAGAIGRRLAEAALAARINATATR